MTWMTRSGVCAGVAGCYSFGAVGWATTALVVMGLSSPIVRRGVFKALGWGFGLGVRLWRWRASRRKLPSTNHGSARWVTECEAEAAGLFDGSGLIFGKMAGRMLRHPSRESNMIVFAPQGTGKGVGIVIPNLLSHPGSVICIDPKSENFAVTAAARLKVGPVWLLSMAETGPSHCFNPMDTVETGSGNDVAQAARLAELIMPHEVSNEAHWRTKSVQWATGLILHVAYRFADEPARRNLGMVHEYLSLPPASMVKLIEAMLRSPLQVVRETGAELARGCGSSEGLSILSSMVKGTSMFSMGRRSGVLCSRSDFAITDLFGAEPASLFLQVPLGDMAVYASWLRVMIGLANSASMAVLEIPERRPLFVLDEAATLGEIKEIQNTIGQGRAYHQKIFIYQDMAQLKKANAGWASVIANCQINVAFAVNDFETADILSKRLGDQTVATTSFGVSSGADAMLSHHQNMGQGEHGRRLLQPNEILHLDEDKALVSVQGLGLKGPLLASRMAYYREAMFAGSYGTWRGRGASAAHEAVFAVREVEAPPLMIEFQSVGRIGYGVGGTDVRALVA
jgi:type IV secretion system protein VirD4